MSLIQKFNNIAPCLAFGLSATNAVICFKGGDFMAGLCSAYGVCIALGWIVESARREVAERELDEIKKLK